MSFTLIHQAANKIVKKYSFTEYDDLDTFFKGLCVKYPYNSYDFSGVRQGVYTYVRFISDPMLVTVKHDKYVGDYKEVF